MIFSIALIFALLLHIVRAVPGCDNAAPPKDLYNLTYDDRDVQLPFLADSIAVSVKKYGRPNANTKTLECSNLAAKYPTFEKIPHYPYIGGAPNVKHSPECVTCWKLRSKKPGGGLITLLAVDNTDVGFDVSEYVFEELNGGKPGVTMEVKATEVSLSECDYTP